MLEEYFPKATQTFASDLSFSLSRSLFLWLVMLTVFWSLEPWSPRRKMIPKIIPYQYANHSLNWAAGVTLPGGLPQGNCRCVPDLRRGPQMTGHTPRGLHEPAGLTRYPEKSAASGQGVPPPQFWSGQQESWIPHPHLLCSFQLSVGHHSNHDVFGQWLPHLPLKLEPRSHRLLSKGQQMRPELPLLSLLIPTGTV